MKQQNELAPMLINFPRQETGDTMKTVSNVRTRPRTVDPTHRNGTLLQPRPSTVFDVTDVNHRKHYLYFSKHHAWHETSPAFFLEHPHISVPSMIASKLLDYYSEQEFGAGNIDF